jgi:hypothetical protein
MRCAGWGADITADALVGDRVWYRNSILLGMVALTLANCVVHPILVIDPWRGHRGTA